MPLRRHYTVDVNGTVRVFDDKTGRLDQHYQGNVAPKPTCGRTEADLYVDNNMQPTLVPNGAGKAAVQACLELLAELASDLERSAPDPRAF
jgi:hypothetical protein